MTRPPRRPGETRAIMKGMVSAWLAMHPQIGCFGFLLLLGLLYVLRIFIFSLVLLLLAAVCFGVSRSNTGAQKWVGYLIASVLLFSALMLLIPDSKPATSVGQPTVASEAAANKEYPVTVATGQQNAVIIIRTPAGEELETGYGEQAVLYLKPGDYRFTAGYSDGNGFDINSDIKDETHTVPNETTVNLALDPQNPESPNSPENPEFWKPNDESTNYSGYSSGRQCSTGKPCGNSCISYSKTCHR